MQNLVGIITLSNRDICSKQWKNQTHNKITREDKNYQMMFRTTQTQKMEQLSHQWKEVQHQRKPKINLKIQISLRGRKQTNHRFQSASQSQLMVNNQAVETKTKERAFTLLEQMTWKGHQLSQLMNFNPIIITQMIIEALNQK